MSDVKFTKGPWHVGSDFDNGEYPITAVYDMRSIYVVSASGDREVISTEERRANARLIASAPELFEALFALTNYFDAQTSITGRTSRGEGVFRQAKAALSKSNPK